MVLLLAEVGYSSVANDNAYKEILEQAENFKRRVTHKLKLKSKLKLELKLKQTRGVENCNPLFLSVIF